MSVHVCAVAYNGKQEYHIRYPGWSRDNAQALADKINGGYLSGQEPLLRRILCDIDFLIDQYDTKGAAVDGAVVRLREAADKIETLLERINK